MAVDPAAFFARWIKALNEFDFATLEQMVDPDFILDFPQSGERIRGFERWRTHIESYPGGLGPDGADSEAARVVEGEERWVITPNFTVVPLSQPNRYTTVSTLIYPNGSRWWIVTLVELRGTRAYRMETFFAPEVPAPLAESIVAYGHG